MTTTEGCPGSWGLVKHAGDGDERVYVSRCSHCGEFMVIIGYHHGYTGPADSPEHALQLALQQRGISA